MKRKLIITESQYIKLQELLFEAPYRTLYSKIQENDIIEIINKGVTSKFKVRIFANNYIIMDGITKNVSDYVFAIDKDGLWKSNFEAKKILKNDEKKSNKNIDTWPSFTTVITSFKLIRDNKVIDVADIDTLTTKPTTEPEPTREPVGKPDEISEPVEMDPNTPENDEELKAAGEEARKKIDYSKDPLLKKAFHRQAGFWNQFRAELAGKSSESDGIRSVLNMLGKYTNKKVKDKFGDTFTEDKQAKFKIISRTRLGVLNDIYTFLIRKWTEGDADTLTLTELGNKPEGLRLIIKDRKKNEPDVYLCTLKKLQDGKEQEEEIEVQFIKSAGYNPTITGKEPIKPIK
jgi:hypothetical protein